MRTIIALGFTLAALAGPAVASATQPLCPQAQALTVVSQQGADNGQLICAAG